MSPTSRPTDVEQSGSKEIFEVDIDPPIEPRSTRQHTNQILPNIEPLNIASPPSSPPDHTPPQSEEGEESSQERSIYDLSGSTLWSRIIPKGDEEQNLLTVLIE